MALELCDLSVYSFMERLKNGDKFDIYLYELLNVAGVLSYSDLMEYYVSGLGRDCNNYNFIILGKKILDEKEKIEVLLKKYNLKGKESDIVMFSSCNNILDSVRNYNDWLHKAGELDCFISFEGNRPIKKQIGELSIAELRILLSTFDLRCLKNGLRCYFGAIGKSKIDMYANSIRRYDMQLDRLYKEICLDGCEEYNIFDYMRSEREDIVVSQLSEIYEFLLSNADEFVFGKVSDRMCTSIIRETDLYYKGEFQDRLIDIIVNCLTLSELEEYKNSLGLLSFNTFDGIGPVLLKRLTK